MIRIMITAELIPFGMGSSAELLPVGMGSFSESLCHLAWVRVSQAYGFWHGSVQYQAMTLFILELGFEIQKVFRN